MRGIVTVSLVLLSFVSYAATTHPQACGKSFAEIGVEDSNGKSITGATIELVTEFPDEVYREIIQREDTIKISPLYAPAIKISAEEVQEILKHEKRPEKTEDFCGNPIKQRAGSTKLKMRDNVQVNTNMGFCTSEGYLQSFLLKVSAPGYVTDYYAAQFLGGCRSVYKIALTKK